VEDASSTDFLAGMYREQQGRGTVQGSTDDGQLVDPALTDAELDDDCENVELTVPGPAPHPSYRLPESSPVIDRMVTS